MNAIAQTAPTVELGSVAEELNINAPFIARILRTIVWHGHGDAVIRFMRHEETLRTEMRARRGERR